MVCSVSAQTLLQQRYLIQQSINSQAGYQSYLAIDLQTHRRCMIRALSWSHCNASEAIRQMRLRIQREVLVLYQIRHPQISQLLAVFEERQHLFFVQEFIPGQSLHDWLHLRQQWGERFSEADIIHVLRQLLPVLAHLHEHGVAHGNISLASVMVRSPQDIALSILEKSVASIAWEKVDLSLLPNFTQVKALASQWAEAPNTEVAGVPGAIASPLLYSLEDAIAADIQSLAAMCLVMLAGPHLAAQAPEQIRTQINKILEPVGDRLGAILGTMISVNAPRLTAKDVLNQLETMPLSPASTPSKVPLKTAATVQLPFSDQSSMRQTAQPTIRQPQNQPVATEHRGLAASARKSTSELVADPHSLVAQVRALVQHATRKRLPAQRTVNRLNQSPRPQTTRLDHAHQGPFHISTQLSWMQIGVGALVVGLVGIPSLHRLIDRTFFDNDVWISGTRVARSEVAQIMALTTTRPNSPNEPWGESSTGGGVAFDNPLRSMSVDQLSRELEQAQPIDFAAHASAIAFVDDIQDGSPHLYTLQIDTPTQITLALESAEATATVLQLTPNRIEAIAQDTQQWSGAVLPGGQYIVQVNGTGAYLLNVTQTSANP